MSNKKTRKPAPARQPEMTDAQALSNLIDLLDYASDAGAFARLDPKLWAVKKLCREQCAGLALRLNNPPAPQERKKG